MMSMLFINTVGYLFSVYPGTFLIRDMNNGYYRSFLIYKFIFRVRQLHLNEVFFLFFLLNYVFS